MKNSRQVRKVSHHHRRPRLAQYVDLADQVALLMFAVADITEPAPLTVQAAALPSSLTESSAGSSKCA